MDSQQKKRRIHKFSHLLNRLDITEYSGKYSGE